MKQPEIIKSFMIKEDQRPLIYLAAKKCGSDDLFDGISERLIQVSLAARCDIFACIAHKNFNSEIYSILKHALLGLSKFEVERIQQALRRSIYHEGLHPLRNNQISKLLSQQNNPEFLNYGVRKKYNNTADISNNPKINLHHVIARMYKSGGFEVSRKGIIKIPYLGDPYDLLLYNHHMRISANRSVVKLRGSSDRESNGFVMSVERHNALNKYLPGYVFPNLQIYLEMKGLPKRIYQAFLSESLDFREMERIVKLPFDELYQRSSYELIKADGSIISVPSSPVDSSTTPPSSPLQQP